MWEQEGRDGNMVGPGKIILLREELSQPPAKIKVSGISKQYNLILFFMVHKNKISMIKITEIQGLVGALDHG